MAPYTTTGTADLKPSLSHDGVPPSVYAAIIGGVLLALAVALVCFCRRRARSKLVSKYKFNNDGGGVNDGFGDSDDVQLLDLNLDPTAAPISTPTDNVATAEAAGPVSSAAGLSSPAAAKKVRRSRASKFVAPEIRLGRATQAADGLADLMGYTNMTIIQHIMATGGDVDAIINEIMWNGTAEDKQNLQGVLDGTYQTNDADASPEELAARRMTIDELMETEQVKASKLSRAHVLGIRLYSTSTYASINNPLRSDPPTKPHPFAVLTYYISEGIKLLRSVAARLPNAHEPQDFWRGMKDLTISDAFLTSGGTEFACMSTSLSQEIAIDFALSKAPMILKLETKDFMSRGADVSFLSVYPGEGEMLFPPLTFLRPITKETFVKNGKEYLLVRCEPVIP